MVRIPRELNLHNSNNEVEFVFYVYNNKDDATILKEAESHLYDRVIYLLLLVSYDCSMETVDEQFDIYDYVEEEHYTNVESVIKLAFGSHPEFNKISVLFTELRNLFREFYNTEIYGPMEKIKLNHIDFVNLQNKSREILKVLEIPLDLDMEEIDNFGLKHNWDFLIL